jgi:hypothetical protein
VCRANFRSRSATDLHFNHWKIENLFSCNLSAKNQNFSTASFAKFTLRRAFCVMKTLLHRYLVLLTLAFWMGGFTFYTGVVIHTANHVMSGERDVGFITQQVTNWLNRIGVLSLVILAWAAWSTRRGIPRQFLIFSWFGMAATQIGLYFIHPVLDQMMDTSAHKIHGAMDVFFNWHRLYMAVATAQWGAALVFLWLIVMLWRQADLQSAKSVASTVTQTVATK